MVTIVPPKTNLGTQFGAALGQGMSQGLQLAVQRKMEDFEIQRRERRFIEQGMDPELAALAAVSSVGGQTSIVQAEIERRIRDRPGAQTQPEVAKEPTINDKIAEATSTKGLTPKEVVAREEHRESRGTPLFEEAMQSHKTLRDVSTSLDTLSALNDSGKLPKNLGRINIDKEGNLVVPFGANPETQRWVKTINQFMAGAKDSVGAKVSNFELASYMKQYPGLVNTQEGRRQILEQMKIVNKINSVYYDSLKDVVSRAGGVGKADWGTLRLLAEEKAKPVMDSLVKKMGEISLHEKLPQPDQYKGRRFRDKETGVVFKSDGKEWIKE